MLPQLLAADALKEGEVGVALEVTDKDSYYPDLALLTGEGIKTVKPKDQVVTINGTVTKKIGKRTYTAAIYRPTGLYAAPGRVERSKPEMAPLPRYTTILAGAGRIIAF